MKQFNLLKRLAALAVCVVSGVIASTAYAYPDKAVRIVVPYAVGGANDQVARLIASRLQEKTGQSFVVENRAGAGGVVGMTSVASAAPDGYTLIVTETGAASINPALSQKITYDTLRDFEPVAAIIRLPLVIVAHPSTGIKTLGDLVSYSKRQGDGLSYASAGTGTAQHLAMEQLAKRMKLDVVHIPYRGGSPAMTDLIGGQVPLLPVSVSTAIPHVKAGQIVPVAGLSAERSTGLPDVPTVGEQGYPAVDFTPWQGIFTPSGTPQEIVEYLNTQIREVLAESATQAKLSELGVELLDLPLADFKQFVQEDIQKWAGIVRQSGISLD